MVAVKGADIRQNFKYYCDLVHSGETLIVSRPKNQNIVMLSEARYNELMKRQRNAEYLEKLEQSFRQLENGEVVHKTMKELRAMEQ